MDNESDGPKARLDSKRRLRGNRNGNVALQINGEFITPKWVEIEESSLLHSEKPTLRGAKHWVVTIEVSLDELEDLVEWKKKTTTEK